MFAKVLACSVNESKSLKRFIQDSLTSYFEDEAKAYILTSNNFLYIFALDN